jgi:uncharacterized membrane protein YfcA
VAIKTAEGVEVGVSKKAAQSAVMQTVHCAAHVWPRLWILLWCAIFGAEIAWASMQVISRSMFLPLFPLLLPPLLTSILSKRLPIMQNKRVFFLTERSCACALLPDLEPGRRCN